MPVNKPNNFRRSERGNVFLIILLGIALFAGLSLVIARSMQSETTARMSNRELKLAASEIIEYGSRIERAVSRLRQKGCSENEITFEDNQDYSRETGGTGFVYTNPDAPADFTCHIFNASGGNVQGKLPVAVKAAVNPALVNPSSMHPQSFVIYPLQVTGVGTDAGAGGSDLAVVIGRLRRETCIMINSELGLTLAVNPPQETFDCKTPFIGGFGNCTDTIGDSATDLERQTAFCVHDTDEGDFGYNYVQVLLAR